MKLIFWLHMRHMRLHNETRYIRDVLRNLVPFVQTLNCNFTKSNTPRWVFLMFFKLYKSRKAALLATFKNFVSFEYIVLFNLLVPGVH